MTPIQFGTDGWRGIIGETFRRENVERIVRAYAVHLHRQGQFDQGIVIGYDARFLSERMARYAAHVLAEAGVHVRLGRSIAPTPAVSCAVVHENVAGGLVVTASHNPPEYNGLKFKASVGGSASGEEIRQIAACLDLPILPGRGRIDELDIIGIYRAAVSSSLPAPNGTRRLKIVVDPMHGAASGIAASLLRERGHEAIEIRAERNPIFGGVNPEPIPPHVGALAQAVREHRADIGVAMDGDADRIGVVTAQGEFFDAHRILSFLARSLLAAGQKGRIVKTVSTTAMLDRICAHYGAPLAVTPVGFKHICQEILAGGVLVAGEESGGLWTAGSIPERDGIRMSLLLADLLASHDEPLHEIWRHMTDEFGTFVYRRRDRLVPERFRPVIERRARALSTIAGMPVHDAETLDGVKLSRADGHWLMFRFSGTEPLLRLYAEGNSEAMCDELLDDAERLVERVTQNATP